MAIAPQSNRLVRQPAYPQYVGPQVRPADDSIGGELGHLSRRIPMACVTNQRQTVSRCEPEEAANGCGGDAKLADEVQLAVDDESPTVVRVLEGEFAAFAGVD